MKNRALLILIFSAIFFFSSCHDRKLQSSTLYLQYKNMSSEQVAFYNFPVPNQNTMDSVWFNLNPGELFTSNGYVSEPFLPSEKDFTFNADIYPVFFLDSAQIQFTDSLLVSHYSYYTDTSAISISYGAIFFSESRNVFNFDNFSIQKIDEYKFIATYIFTDEDVAYADSIHE